MLSEDFDVVNFSNTRLGIGVHESEDSGSDVWHENKDSGSELLLFFFTVKASCREGLAVLVSLKMPCQFF